MLFDLTNCRLLDDRSGVVAVEFAMVAPLLVLMFTGLFDLQSAILANMDMDAAAQYGAMRALADSADSKTIAAATHRAFPDIAVAARYLSCPGRDCGHLPRGRYAIITSSSTRRSMLAGGAQVPIESEAVIRVD